MAVGVCPRGGVVFLWIVACPLNVADLVRKRACVAFNARFFFDSGHRKGKLGRSRTTMIDLIRTTTAAIAFFLSKQQHYHICSEFFALLKRFIEKAIARRLKPIKVVPLAGRAALGLRGVRRLVAVHDPEARGDATVLVLQMCMQDKQCDASVDVSGHALCVLRIDDEHIDFVPAVLCPRWCTLWQEGRLLRIGIRNDKVRHEFPMLAKLRSVVEVNGGETVTQRMHAVNRALVVEGPGYVLPHHNEGSRRRRLSVS